MFDLIDECAEELKELGYQNFETGKYSLCVGKINVDSAQKSKQTGFDEGRYMIFNCPLLHLYQGEADEYVCARLSSSLKNMAKANGLTKRSRILVVGLGNPQILADSLGEKVLSAIDLNFYRAPLRMFKFAPNIFFNTGINSHDVVHMLAIWLDVDGVVVIDALGTSSPSRLTSSIQINDRGMTPASAVNSLGKKLCRDTLGVPCIAIGVPTMLLAGKIAGVPEKMILTPKDVHEEIDRLAKIIARAIQKAF